jgi:hypothetical protein
MKELASRGRHVRRVFGRLILGAVVLASAACGGAAATPTPAPATPGDTATPFATPSSSPLAYESLSPIPSLGPTTMPSGWAYADLDGVAAPADLAHRLPMAIMIDDNAVARPQSGFTSASIVVQAMADGGEDRYMLVFQEGTAADIGPVRSGRPYFVYWAAEYAPLFGHIGGDAETLGTTVPSLSKYLYNMDELNGGSCAYHRITTRAMPHNDYTSSATLIGCAAQKAYPATIRAGLAARTFVDQVAAAQRPASASISIPYRTGNVSYTYDPASDLYLRSVEGKLQTDAANGKQVTAANVVVMFQSYAMVQATDDIRPVVGNVGSGDAIVFKEGKAIQGTWKKKTQTDLTRFYDTSGAEISLVRGQIFIQSVPLNTAVTYK